MYNRTCILVTHNASLCLPHAHFAVVLDNGRVVAQGSANEVIDSGKLGEDLSKSRPASQGPSRIASRVPSNLGEEGVGQNGHANGANGKANGDSKAIGKGDSNGMPKKDVKTATAQTETKATGSVQISIIIMYLKAMGP
ncbi:Transporter of the ATP-binding cassette (ABC), partial [Cryomyces antarcticus]